MAETTVTECYHPDVVEAFAAAWASIDGRLESFERDKRESWTQHSEDTGTYEGYMAEANELLQRANKRIAAFDLFDRLDPSPKDTPSHG